MGELHARLEGDDTCRPHPGKHLLRSGVTCRPKGCGKRGDRKLGTNLEPDSVVTIKPNERFLDFRHEGN